MRSKSYLFLLSVVFLVACAGTPPPAPPVARVLETPATIVPAAGLEVSAADALFVGAGDIARCGSERANAEATGDLIRSILMDVPEATVFTAGDNAYQEGTAQQFNECYEPAWGSFNDRTMPSPGNHDYLETPGRATAYFDYFDFYRGDPAAKARGYYSFDLKDWHIVSLNSDKSRVQVNSELKAQVEWLEADLKATDKRCILAYWHHPLFSSGLHGGQSGDPGRRVNEFWRVLERYGADVVVNGHDHDYERFAPQDPSGISPPNGKGIVEFVIGTGGDDLRNRAKNTANSKAFEDQHYGILVLTLHPNSYDWSFRTIDGQVLDPSTSPVECREKSHQPK